MFEKSHIYKLEILEISNSVLIPLVNVLVTSRFDYCNTCLCNGIAKPTVQMLQRIQNSIASAITTTPKFDHIRPIL